MASANEKFLASESLESYPSLNQLPYTIQLAISHILPCDMSSIFVLRYLNLDFFIKFPKC